MVLKFAKACKAKRTDNANDGRRIGIESFGHGAHAEKNESTGMLQDRTKNFPALGRKPFETLLENDRLRCGCRCLTLHDRWVPGCQRARS